jgi:tRNA modification GTPase
MRVSGPDSARILAELSGGLPPPRRAVLRRLRDADGAVLDQGLVVWMPGPGSYTGEDSFELSLHGGRAVLAGVCNALISLGSRPAEPGEFTRRAFLNGRMDLLEAEAVGDLIDAETEAQRRQALRQLDGKLGEIYRDWAGRLRWLLAQQEALIDFPDEDLPPEVEDRVFSDIAALTAEIATHLDDGRRGERLRDGLVFAVSGPPNVGKSSLVNALAERDVAIVSPVAGTTRDAIEVRIVLAGVPVTLVDTAGLRDSGDAVEAEGVRRARARAAEADFRLIVGDTAQGVASAFDAHSLRICNKIDLPGEVPSGTLGISVRTGAGMGQLRDALAGAATQLTEASGPPPLTRARHRAALAEALERLTTASAAELPELRGEDLRLALRSIGRITGEVGVEDLLGDIFGKFCIGK